MSLEEIHEERIMLGLRCCEGVDVAILPDDKLAAELAAARLCPVSEPLSSVCERRVRIPENQWFVSDDIISDLL